MTDGFWSLNSHWTSPATPLYADFELGHHREFGWKAGDAEFRDPTVAPDRDNYVARAPRHIYALSDLLTAAWSAHSINLWAAVLIR